MMYNKKQKEKAVFRRLKQYPDLHKYSRIHSIKRIIITVIWYGFWLFTYYLYFIASGKKLFSGLLTSQFLVSVIILIVIMFPVKVFKVQKIITDRSYDGIIKDIKLEDKIKIIMPGARSSDSMKVQECLTIITEDDLGKSHEYIYWEKDEIDNQAYFKIGARVTHYKEFKYLHNIDREEGEQLCVICGQLIYDDRYTCARCKHSFIS
jgi:hypothetical protein